MDHLRPDLQIDAHIDSTGGLGQPNGVVEQCFRGANLDQQRRKAGEIGVDRGSQRQTRVGAIQVHSRHIGEICPLYHRVGSGFGRHRLTDRLQVDPW